MYEYFLIQADNAGEMIQKVNGMLAEGWEPYMGLTVGLSEYGLQCLFQWMIRIALPPAPPQMEKHHLERGKESLPAESTGTSPHVPAAWLRTSVAAGENL